MTAFDDRKTAAEAKFTHDQEFQFKTIAVNQRRTLTPRTLTMSMGSTPIGAEYARRITPMGYALDAAPGAPDIRDRIYQPTLAPVPDELMPDLSRTTILDQGKDGACTGFGLAITYWLYSRLE